MCPAEVLCLYEDEVVLLQDKLLQQGLDKGLPGIAYELADMQVRPLGALHTCASALHPGGSDACVVVVTGRHASQSSAYVLTALAVMPLL